MYVRKEQQHIAALKGWIVQDCAQNARKEGVVGT